MFRPFILALVLLAACVARGPGVKTALVETDQLVRSSRSTFTEIPVLLEEPAGDYRRIATLAATALASTQAAQTSDWPDQHIWNELKNGARELGGVALISRDRLVHECVARGFAVGVANEQGAAFRQESGGSDVCITIRADVIIAKELNCAELQTCASERRDVYEIGAKGALPKKASPPRVGASDDARSLNQESADAPEPAKCPVELGVSAKRDAEGNLVVSDTSVKALERGDRLLSFDGIPFDEFDFDSERTAGQKLRLRFKRGEKRYYLDVPHGCEN